ncbi:hypothetical protein [Shouchella lehensis]|uniref:Uncharacterized protein n=1 Tax=Shouchella lehensis TaxID=300825 RepID=A0A4Y7WLS5_9BACI|nr:hypothetical protein [Shouchella lehensis]MBG9783122.1 hypothetical protein [Shouchella lehensis]TES49518.1 hypothetical protein E2L03_08600 [Shouchella lehensis]
MLPRQIGDKHVLTVVNYLKMRLLNKSYEETNDLAAQTVNFIVKEVSTLSQIDKVKSKFENESPDNYADLELILKDGTSQKVNLFVIKKNAQIQMKNPGAKSVFSNYFQSEGMQLKFNHFLDRRYYKYLSEVLKLVNCEPSSYHTVTEMRREVNKFFPKFTDEINPVREKFLNSLREYSYELLKEEYNEGSYKNIEYAFNSLLLLNDINIVTRYDDKNKNICSGVGFFNHNLNLSYPLRIFKKGQNKVGIRIGKQGLSLRFKFESAPNSAIKLVSSAEEFEQASSYSTINLHYVRKFEMLIKKHTKSIETLNESNAIGKCHEAIFYYYFLKKNDEIEQVDEKVFTDMFIKYSSSLSEETIQWLISGVQVSYEKLKNFLNEKYGVYELDSIQLVPESYIVDPLDSSDMKINLKVKGKYRTEEISLKALKKIQKNTTVKNAGMGKILGSQYFNLGDLKEEISEAKAKYLSDEKTHMESLEFMADKIGNALEFAPQNNLRNGLKAMLGNCTVVITYYQANKAVVLQHGNIDGEVIVLRAKPTTIQNTLQWNNGTEKISIRAKFSKGQSHGWSSLKLDCNYSIEVK